MLLTFTINNGTSVAKVRLDTGDAGELDVRMKATEGECWAEATTLRCRGYSEEGRSLFATIVKSMMGIDVLPICSLVREGAKSVGQWSVSKVEEVPSEPIF